MVTHIPLALFVGCIGQQVVWFWVRHADVVNNSQKTAAYQFDALINSGLLGVLHPGTRLDSDGISRMSFRTAIRLGTRK